MNEFKSLSVKNVAEIIGVSESTVRKIPEEKLPFHRTEGSHRRYDLQDIIKYMYGKTPKRVDVDVDHFFCNDDQHGFSSNSFHYFFMNFCYVQDIASKSGLTLPTRMNAFLDDICEGMQNQKLVLWQDDRQKGKSTILCAFALWKSIFNDDHRTVLISLKSGSAEDMRGVIIRMFAYLPQSMKMKMVVNNTDRIEFANGSVIRFATPNITFRGTANLYLFDEFAYCQYDVFEKMWSSIYSMATSTNAGVVIASSPNPFKFNHFDILYSGGHKPSEYDGWYRIHHHIK